MSCALRRIQFQLDLDHSLVAPTFHAIHAAKLTAPNPTTTKTLPIDVFL
jgi:hypothetical protein